MAVISIKYDEGNKKNLGYESVIIHYGNDEKEIFNTGNFVKDWYDMRKFMIQNLLDSELAFSHSSTVNHFIMEGAPYDSAYLKTNDDGIPYFSYVYDDESIEFFVPKGTQPTFNELKEICK